MRFRACVKIYRNYDQALALFDCVVCQILDGLNVQQREYIVRLMAFGFIMGGS